MIFTTQIALVSQTANRNGPILNFRFGSNRGQAMTTTSTPINFMGEDFIAEVDLTIRDWGSPPSGRSGRPEDYDPGSGPDFSIDAIRLREDFGPRPGIGRYGPAFEATGALFRVLAASRTLDEAILSTLDREASTDDYFTCEEDKYDYSDRD